MSSIRNFQELIFRQVLPVGDEVRVWLGDAPIESKAGAGGGWQVIDRPKRKAFTDWAGYGPYVVELVVLFDGWGLPMRSVEPDIEKMRRMMRVPDKTLRHPPIIQVEGAIPLSQLRWVIQNMESQEENRLRRDGERVRSFQRITLLEFVPADVLTAPPSPAAAAQEATAESSSSTATPTTRTHTVKSGDTLYAIAARYLGAGSKWPEIASLNNIRDPRSLRVGTVLRLP